MDGETRRQLIERYKHGSKAVYDALEGITDLELDFRASPEVWTAREVAHHLGDSEINSAFRLRKLIAEDDTVIQGYNEVEFAKRLYYDRPIDSSLAAMMAARNSSAELLERLTEEEWGRVGTHTEFGKFGLIDWLEYYASHPFDHAAQIAESRRLAREAIDANK
jgi:DinB superfamily